MSSKDPSAEPAARQMFCRALEIPSPELRREFLATACGTDPGLRGLVEKLLETYSTDDFLERSPFAKSRDSFSVFPDADLESGSRLGRYRVVRKIGEGGCGTVYSAEQIEGVRRLLALKVIKPGMDSKAVIGRFEAERQALALMDHPHIAKVFDAGATENGRPFLAMELVEGRKITSYCFESKLSVPDRVRLFLQVCDAVQHAHQKGIIHRDLKPSNILVTEQNGALSVKVIDFGIAKAVEGRLTDATIHTGLHQFLGTPAYMSPEQADLNPDIDTRTDIYSLGVLLYELLTGSPPFDNHELLTAGVDTMRRIIREVEPGTPSQRSKSQDHVGPRIDTDLDWIVLKCLEKDRSRRYASANGLAAEIQRHLNGEPVQARPPSPSYRFHKFVRRNKLQVAAGSVVFATLVFAAIFGTWHAWKAKRAEQVAKEQAIIARRETEDAAKARDFLIESLFGGDVNSERRDTNALTVAATEALARKVARQLEGTFTDHPATEAQIHYRLSRVFSDKPRFQIRRPPCQAGNGNLEQNSWTISHEQHPCTPRTRPRLLLEWSKGRSLQPGDQFNCACPKFDQRAHLCSRLSGGDARESPLL